MTQDCATPRTRLGGALLTVIGACAGFAGMLLLYSTTVMTTVELEEPQPVQVEMLLLEVGLSPEALAAAGITPVQTTALVIAAEEHLVTHGPAIDAAKADAIADAAAYQAMAQKVRSGTATSQEKESLPGLQTAKAAAETALDTALDGLFDAAIGGITGDPLTRLTNLRAAAERRLPAPYGVVERSDEAWVALHRALRAKAVVDRLETDLEEPHATALADADDDGDVSAAKTRLTDSGSAVEAAFASALAAE